MAIEIKEFVGEGNIRSVKEDVPQKKRKPVTKNHKKPVKKGNTKK